ncbi:MAG: hypothetical protein ACRC20_10165 [Segniliparus sp.]|uniref:hypothetical protein n=1 Tax=Segniliparus sp. TaxID=2804064 RepID=UPI003F3A85E1
MSEWNHEEERVRFAASGVGLRLRKGKARNPAEPGHAAYGLCAHGRGGGLGLYGEPDGALMFSDGASGHGLTLDEAAGIVADVAAELGRFAGVSA